MQEPPHVAELHYFGNNTYEGNARAFNRWESFTSDGGADSFYNETALAQTPHPDGTATLELAGSLSQSEFYCASLCAPLCPGIPESLAALPRALPASLTAVLPARPRSCRSPKQVSLPTPSYHPTLTVPFFRTPADDPAPGDSVLVMEGPNVGQTRRLVSGSAGDRSIVINAPFDPPLSNQDILAVTGYRGGFTIEGNRYHNGTCFQFFGGAVDVVISGNDFDEMFDATAAIPTLPSADANFVGALVGGGGMYYAVSCEWLIAHRY